MFGTFGSLLAVAEEGRLLRAARRLGVPQPSISSQLRRIERMLGTELFDRSNRGVSLTRVGRDLLPHLRAVDQHMRAVENGEGLDRLLHPPVRIGVECRMLLDSVLHEELVVLVPPGHRLAARKQVAVNDIAGAEWVCSLPGTAWHDELLRVFAAVRSDPPIRCFAACETSLHEMARHFGALSLGTASSAARSGLCLSRLSGGFRRTMVLRWNSVTVPEFTVQGIIGRIRDSHLRQGDSRADAALIGRPSAEAGIRPAASRPAQLRKPALRA